MKISRAKIGIFTLATVLAILVPRSCVMTSYSIPSSGMENTLYKNERILVNKWSYGLRLPFMSVIGYHRWCKRPVSGEEVIVFNNPANSTEPVISKREVFIGRCIGHPGDTLLFDSLFNNAISQKKQPDQKLLYEYPVNKENELQSLLTRLSLQPEKLSGKDSLFNYRCFSRYEYYLLQQAITGECWIMPVHKNSAQPQQNVLIIPQKGKDVLITPSNCTLLCNTLVLHEGKKAMIKNDTIYLNGKPIHHYRFSQDYYWVVSDNALNFSDSRLFGLVPQSHLIGRATHIWYSKDKHRIGNKIY